MSRHPQDPRAHYGDRYLPKPQTPKNRPPSTDPAGYISNTASSDGWRAHHTFEPIMPHKARDPPQIPPFRTLKSTNEGQYRLKLKEMKNFHHSQGSRGSVPSPGGMDTERSVQNSRHSRRPDERLSERHASTAHDARKPRRSEGRGSESFSAGGTSHAVPRERPGRYFSDREQNDMIEYIKAGKSWRQIGEKLGRDLKSVTTHWYNHLRNNPRANGVKYNPEYDMDIDFKPEGYVRNA